MKIIFLAGKKNVGKTTTMRMLFNILTKNKKVNTTKIPGTSAKDFHCIFKYKNKNVAIFSAGDVLRLIFLGIFIYSQADYLIMPFNVGGKQKAEIISYFKKYNSTRLIIKTVCQKGASKIIKDKANLKDCNAIIKEIK